MASAQLSIAYVPLDDLLAARDDRNPKLHDLPSIQESIERFGFVESVIRDGRTGKMLAGHGRLEALDGLRQEQAERPSAISISDAGWLVPVTEGWASADDAEAAGVLVALNRHPERGGWDNQALADILTALDPSMLSAVGYETGEVDDLLALLDADTLAGDGGARIDPSFTDLREPYAAKQVRSVILDYPLDVYDRVQADLTRLRAARQIEDNATLVATLLAEV